MREEIIELTPARKHSRGAAAFLRVLRALRGENPLLPRLIRATSRSPLHFLLRVLRGENLRALFSDPVVACSVFLLFGYVGGLWTGVDFRAVNLADLSQRRAWNIAAAIYQDCAKRFVDKAVGLGATEIAAARCLIISDMALEEMYRAGVSPLDKVMEEAKKMAREEGLE